MYEAEEPRGTSEAADTAAWVVGWLGARDEVERRLSEPLGGPTSQRDDTVARMADALQATAHGLDHDAAAVWAGIPSRMLRSWLSMDPAFAAAMAAAAALAQAHGVRPRHRITPATIRVALSAIARGDTWPAAAKSAGIPVRRFRELWQASPAMAALVDAAQRARRSGRGTQHFLPTVSRRRRPRRPAAADRPSYRLVQRDDPMISGSAPERDQD
ncbi:hypothetical protein [Streptomyces sp. NRRL F-2664]|uniref:hypothetical protein n=1 Tax=Streptomyces sp. NRRL F-2664 TaxID=1463842 RepID=UPI000D13FDBC|nr:hypothetical protein [Streptomyces sp. NRRL F-2664]